MSINKPHKVLWNCTVDYAIWMISQFPLHFMSENFRCTEL